MSTCRTCNQPATYSVLFGGDIDRVYLPNQNARREQRDTHEIWFCHPCMRAIEDNLRATILYLKKEGGTVWGKKKDPQ